MTNQTLDDGMLSAGDADQKKSLADAFKLRRGFAADKPKHTALSTKRKSINLCNENTVDLGRKMGSQSKKERNSVAVL